MNGISVEQTILIAFCESNLYSKSSNLREFVLTTVILPPGVKNPGSVLLGLTPFPVDPVDPVDPLDPVESSWRPKNELQYNEFGTFCRNLGSIFRYNL